jgi:hypothetical protein
MIFCAAAYWFAACSTDGVAAPPREVQSEYLFRQVGGIDRGRWPTRAHRTPSTIYPRAGQTADTRYAASESAASAARPASGAARRNCLRSPQPPRQTPATYLMPRSAFDLIKSLLISKEHSPAIRLGERGSVLEWSHFHQDTHRSNCNWAPAACSSYYKNYTDYNNRVEFALIAFGSHTLSTHLYRIEILSLVGLTSLKLIHSSSVASLLYSFPWVNFCVFKDKFIFLWIEITVIGNNTKCVNFYHTGHMIHNLLQNDFKTARKMVSKLNSKI